MEYGLFRPKRMLFEVNTPEWIGTRATEFSGRELDKMRTIDILSHMLGFEGLLPPSTLPLILNSWPLCFRRGSRPVQVPNLRLAAGAYGSIAWKDRRDWWVCLIPPNTHLSFPSLQKVFTAS